MALLGTTTIKRDFSKIKISIASPESILARSRGEVLKPETINYRSYKPERDGLMCEKIFGPTKDWECYCGKYKRVRYKGIICDRCGVEVTTKSVRRERMGHISLAVPVVHTWFFRSVPSKLGALLDLSTKELERIIYYEVYVVINPGEPGEKQGLKFMDRLPEELYYTIISEYEDNQDLDDKDPRKFVAKMGGEAIKALLKKLDLNEEAKKLREILKETKSEQKRADALKRLKVVEAFRNSYQPVSKEKQKRDEFSLEPPEPYVYEGNKPEYMVMDVLPVIPPELRPLVPLEGGRFATSDLNDLYRRVIIRNNRLKKLIDIRAPEVILRNEKRMLQEAVDALLDNSRKANAVKAGEGNRALKSLSDSLKGKQGRFRQNLLGKRVDYSGRSVIVVGPELKLHECGLPKDMAIELFQPFVIRRLVERGLAKSVKSAKKMIDRKDRAIWDVLEKVIDGHPVLLNRAPTLHRLGIQAFQPVLIEGKAIQIHPLVCTAFNADFDGDQMAVHVPLSQKAVWEARQLMLSSRNLLKPADGEPIISPSKDMVLGIYYLSKTDNKSHKGDGRVFADMDEVELAYELDQVDLHARIKLMATTWYDDEGNRLPQPQTRLVETTVGRVLLNRVLPPNMQFINRELDKGGIKDLIAELYEVCGEETTTEVADAIKDIGFKYATRSGYTLAVSDITIPPEKAQIIESALQEQEAVERDYRRGLLTEQEKNERVIQIWQDTTKKVSDAVKATMDPHGNLAAQAISGATKGGFGPISQLAGMRGLMADPSGRIIPLPIRSNFREGLTALEYFISTHGARKGLADTALRTADAGYLTRRLVDVAQDVIINDEDCGTQDGISIRRSDNVAEQSMSSRLYGRVAAERVVDPDTGEVLAERDELLDHPIVRRIVASNVQEVKVRSPLTCELLHGVCAKCYGLDLGRGKMVEVGTAVGIVAAQSIGEPGTQLTLRTFHTGGVAAGGDITTGLPRVEELFEARRQPKGEATVSEIGGIVSIMQSDRYSDLREVHVRNSQLLEEPYDIPEDWKIAVEDGGEVSQGDVIAFADENTTIVAQNKGRVRIEGNRVIVAREVTEDVAYEIPTTARLLVKDGDRVEPGQPLTEGSLNPHRILRIQGREACQMYLLSEVQQVYRSQGQNINDKHFEVIIRKMMSKVQIIRPGDSDYLPGDLVDRLELKRKNEQLLAQGKRIARSIDVLLGITKASLSTDSFLSASSFQHTIKVLAGAAIAAARDPLYGLKENVIIGKLIPAGTGFERGRFDEDQQVYFDSPTSPDGGERRPEARPDFISSYID